MAQTKQTEFRCGDPEIIPYTPGADVHAGDVVVFNGICGIAHIDIPANQLGSLAIGGGQYDCLANVGDVINLGDPVYWDDTNNTAETGATSNTKFGFAAAAKAANDTTVRVFHKYPNF